MSEPMNNEDFMRSMWLSFAQNQTDARKLMMADTDNGDLPQETIEEMVRIYPK